MVFLDSLCGKEESEKQNLRPLLMKQGGLVSKKKEKGKEPLAGQSVEEPAADAVDEAVITANEDLAAELEDVRQQLAECQDKILRMAADFDNTKKRLERERDSILKYAEENILKELLASLDNLERAVAQGRETDNLASLLEGVEMTWKGLLAMLERFGLEPMNSIGETFDPNFHEAVAMEAGSTMPENQVLKEFQKGYMYKDRLLRAAKVIVSSGEDVDKE
jgi:molecular chaperone GrpE